MERKLETRKGDCESCAAADVQLVKRYQNIWMCDECWQKDSAINQNFLQQIDAQKGASNQPVLPDAWKNNATIIRAKKVDASIQLKQDIMNAAAVAIKELQVAILADESIPAEAKQYTFCEVLQGHIATYQKVTFDLQTALDKVNSEKYAFQVNLNEAAARLRKEERDRLQLQDITYQPKPVKVVRPPKEKAPGSPKVNMGKAANTAKARELAAKHGVNADVILAMAVQRNLSPEDACAELLKLTAKKAN